MKPDASLDVGIHLSVGGQKPTHVASFDLPITFRVTNKRSTIQPTVTIDDEAYVQALADGLHELADSITTEHRA